MAVDGQREDGIDGALRDLRTRKNRTPVLVATARDAAVRDETANAPDIDDEIGLGRVLSALEDGSISENELAKLRKTWQLAGGKTPVVGLTGTGGAGKSSVTDELINRFLQHFPEMRIAVISVDPTRRRTGACEIQLRER